MLKKVISMLMAAMLILGTIVIPVSAKEAVTWDPNVSVGSPILGDGNLSAYITAKNTVTATKGVSEDKWYWETTIKESIGDSGYIGITEDASLTINKNGRILYSPLGYLHLTTPVYLEGAFIGDVIGIVLNMDEKTIQYYKNGEVISQVIDFSKELTKPVVYPHVTYTLTGEFSTITNFGATPFEFDIPEGCKPYDESGIWYNLPSQLSVLLSVNEEIQLSLSNNLIDNNSYIWTSDDISVATVDSTGKIKAIGEGTTKINARNASGFYEYINVRVLSKDELTDLRLSVDLKAGSSARLYLSESDDITWTSLSPSVAQIDSNGQVTAVTSGLALIQAKLDGITHDIYVRVRN